MKYYVLTLFSDGQWHVTNEFDSYDALLTFLARRDESSFLQKNFHFTGYPNKGRACYLDGINMNGNDTRAYWKDFGETSERFYETRPYLFMDELDRIVDPRKDRKRILDIRNRLIEADVARFKKRWRTSRYTFEFRREPVPDTGVKEHNYYEFGRYRPWGYRNVKYGHLIRLWRSEEYREYGRRKSLQSDPWYFCERYVSKGSGKSWKDNTKCRKQWMKNTAK